MTRWDAVRLGALATILCAGLGCSSESNPSSPSTSGAMTSAPEAPAPPAPSPPSPPPSPAAPETARYRVTFDATWSPATHPIDIPGSAHFSRLVGSNHAPAVTFWREGGPASQGIKEMAEFGRTNPLDGEIRAAVSAGTAEALYIGPAVDKSPGGGTMEMSVSQRFPLITLVSMIAPSPDWFVGVAGLSLFENGQWVDERRVALDPWDAGTDSGVSFFSPDTVTAPPAPVSRIVTAPLSPGGVVTPLGSFVFTRIN